MVPPSLDTVLSVQPGSAVSKVPASDDGGEDDQAKKAGSPNHRLDDPGRAWPDYAMNVITRRWTKAMASNSCVRLLGLGGDVFSTEPHYAAART